MLLGCVFDWGRRISIDPWVLLHSHVSQFTVFKTRRREKKWGQGHLREDYHLNLSRKHCRVSFCHWRLSRHQTLAIILSVSFFISIYLSIYLSTHLSIHLYVHPRIFLPIYLSITHQSFYKLSIHPLMFQPIHIPIYSSIHPTISHWFYHLYIYLPIHPSIHLFTYIPTHPSLYLSTYLPTHPGIYISIYLSIHLPTDLSFY